MVKFTFFCHKNLPGKWKNNNPYSSVPKFNTLQFLIFLWWGRHFLNSSKSEWIIRKYFTPLCPTIVSKSTKTTWNLSFWQNNITLLLYHNGDEIISGGAYVVIFMCMFFKRNVSNFTHHLEISYCVNFLGRLVEMGSSWNFPARASPSCDGSEPSRAELGHYNFRAETELNFLSPN